MTASALMSLGTRAMFASYAGLQATGHNIANASVDGYSRQEVQLKTATGQFTGAGFFGKGVDIDTVSRVYDKFLSREAVNSKSQSGYDATRSEQLSRLEQIFVGGDQGIGAATGDMLNAMVDVASRPQDLASRQAVLARAADVASRFSSAASRLDDLQTGVTQDLTNSVTHINELARKIAEVNDRIAGTRGVGHTPNDLLDQRDSLVSELGGYLQISTMEADDGTLGVFIAGGQRLVLSNQALQLQVTGDSYDASRKTVGIVEADGLRKLDPSLLAAGSVGGLLRFQNDDLSHARDLLGQLATAVASAVNDQQAKGLDMSVPPGAGAPIFTLGPPRALPADTNARLPNGTFAATVTLTVSDATQLQASEYGLAADANGQWQLTRLADGLTRAVNDGDVVDGFRIDLGAPPPATTDSFRLQPVARAAAGMQRVLENPRGLAAASPVTATIGATNTGTASVAALAVTDPAIDTSVTASFTFVSDSGDYTWELRDAASNALASSGTGTWVAGQPIELNGFSLTLSGVPRNGDTISVQKTAFPAANNGNALQMVALRDAMLVGRQPDGSGQLAGGNTLTDAWAAAMADIGVRVQGAKTASEISTQVASDAKNALSAKTGVNLDEEAARLMQYQQGYQAAAKVLQVAQTIFDVVLRAAGA